MKIFETRQAPNPRRVRIFLAEKAIEIDFEEIDLMQGALKTESFTRLNPMQRVPVLQFDDGSCLSESVAICRYFEELQPEPPLFGRGALGRARIEMWNRRIEHGLFFHVAQAFRHSHPAMAELEVPQVAAWGESNIPKALENLRLINGKLADRPFIAGDDYSIADITALVAVDFMKPARIELPGGADRLQHLQRWHDDVSGRPSAAA